ncbi:hypothetical protein E2C01_038594 [Portunus trituberculatus]|uniref:Uncharacterized protein n=1 Tax=Portunus trituberculatus TaxID=210409 RepID=A0A5B7FIE9_PORTR|nr:hypothetical protein [Portunus trituberculatus]
MYSFFSFFFFIQGKRFLYNINTGREEKPSKSHGRPSHRKLGRDTKTLKNKGFSYACSQNAYQTTNKIMQAAHHHWNHEKHPKSLSTLYHSLCKEVEVVWQNVQNSSHS